MTFKHNLERFLFSFRSVTNLLLVTGLIILPLIEATCQNVLVHFLLAHCCLATLKALTVCTNQSCLRFFLTLSRPASSPFALGFHSLVFFHAYILTKEHLQWFLCSIKWLVMRAGLISPGPLLQGLSKSAIVGTAWHGLLLSSSTVFLQ